MYYNLSVIKKEGLELPNFFFGLKKWDTALLLSSLNLPINDMCLIRHDTSQNLIIKAVAEFYLANNLEKNEKILVRAEKDKSLCENQKKGTQLNFNDALKITKELISENYNVIITKSPGDRLTYRKSYIALVDKYGNFIIEVLGKGFDATDLSKGRISPEIVIQNQHGFNIKDIDFVKRLSMKDVSTTYINQREILCKQRVSFILSSQSEDLPKFDNEKELENIYESLFDYTPTNISLVFVQKLLEHIFEVYKHFIVTKKDFNSLELIGVENNDMGNIYFNIFFK